VKILVDDTIPEEKRPDVEKVVTETIGNRPDADSLVVSVVKLSPGRGWSVFINDLQDPPLVEAIEGALKKAGF
jgi:hypothetical protein